MILFLLSVHFISNEKTQECTAPKFRPKMERLKIGFFMAKYSNE